LRDIVLDCRGRHWRSVKSHRISRTRDARPYLAITFSSNLVDDRWRPLQVIPPIVAAPSGRHIILPKFELWTPMAYATGYSLNCSGDRWSPHRHTAILNCGRRWRPLQVIPPIVAATSGRHIILPKFELWTPMASATGYSLNCSGDQWSPHGHTAIFYYGRRWRPLQVIPSIVAATSGRHIDLPQFELWTPMASATLA